MLGYTGLNDLLAQKFAISVGTRTQLRIEESPRRYSAAVDVKGEVREQEFRIEQANGNISVAALSREPSWMFRSISHYRQPSQCQTQRNVQRFHEEFLSIVSQEL